MPNWYPKKLTRQDFDVIEDQTGSFKNEAIKNTTIFLTSSFKSMIRTIHIRHKIPHTIKMRSRSLDDCKKWVLRSFNK